MAQDDPDAAGKGSCRAEVSETFQSFTALRAAPLVRVMRIGIHQLPGNCFILWKCQSARWESSC